MKDQPAGRDKAGTMQTRGAPGLGVGPDEHTEDLLAGPQLQGLDDRWGRQVCIEEGVPCECQHAPQVRPCVEAVLAGQQVRGRQEILQCCRIDFQLQICNTRTCLDRR